MRENVKVRLVAGSVVVSLPASVLEPVGIKPGDRVLVEAAPPRRLIITKEGKTMTSTERLELEIDLLEKKMQAIDSDQAYKLEQYNSSFFTEEGMSTDAFPLVMGELNRDRDHLAVELAERRLALYDLQGGEVEGAAAPTASEP
jgi:antitoxin component of MazEF toxin-antitoxin module